MRTKLKLVSAIGALVLAGSIGLAGCSSNKPADSATEQAEDSGAGFDEYPVGDDQAAPRQQRRQRAQCLRRLLRSC